jgi:hypothetical protein
MTGWRLTRCLLFHAAMIVLSEPGTLRGPSGPFEQID